MKINNLIFTCFILSVVLGVSSGQRLSILSAVPTPTPTPDPDPGFFVTAREPVSPSPTPTPIDDFTAVIPSPTPSPTFPLDRITAVVPTPTPRSPFTIPPVVTAPGPAPDSCSVKLQNLKECLDKKADFVALGLTHYSYDIKRSCFCFPEGWTELASVSVCGGDQSEPEYYQDHNTMIKVFDYLCQAIIDADSVDVTYDNTYHFPTSIFVDQIIQAIDDENSYSITNFQVLSPDNCFI